MRPANLEVRTALDCAGSAYVKLTDRAVVLSTIFELLGATGPDSPNGASMSLHDEAFWRGIRSMVVDISDAAETMNAALDAILTRMESHQQNDDSGAVM